MKRFDLLPIMIADIDLMLRIRDADPGSRIKLLLSIPYEKARRLSMQYWALDSIDMQSLRTSLEKEYLTYVHHVKLTELESILHSDK